MTNSTLPLPTTATSPVSTSQPPKQQLTYVSSKLTREHLQRHAILYVRQSTGQQLRDHQESTARQYQLTERLLAFGWPQDRIIVIDEDLGISGSGKATRTGFRRLLKLVTEQQVGIVLGLEMSRLARNSKDWSDLFEVSAIFRTLIADEDGLFDPNEPNDRLVLGLKGIISEMELHTMKIRLERGRLNKAQRGELFHDVPVGFVRGDDGLPQFDPDVSAQHAMRLFFDLFESLGSSHALFQHLAAHDIKLPFRTRGGPIEWRLAAKTTVYELLKHPLYAGASERVSARLHWSGGFESCHDLARPVSQFRQLESYDDLIERTLSLSLQGHSNPEIAVILAKEEFVSPRSLEPVSRFMVQKLLESPRCAKQLHDPELSVNHWRAADLAVKVGIPEKRLKDWVTRGWATAVQRPHGRTWVIYADANELNRLQQLAARQTGQGSPSPPENLRTPASIPRQMQ